MSQAGAKKPPEEKASIRQNIDEIQQKIKAKESFSESGARRISSIWDDVNKYLENLGVRVAYNEVFTMIHMYLQVDRVILQRKLTSVEETDLREFLKSRSLEAHKILGEIDSESRDTIVHSHNSPYLIDGILSAFSEGRVGYKADERPS